MKFCLVIGLIFLTTLNFYASCPTEEALSHTPECLILGVLIINSSTPCMIKLIKELEPVLSNKYVYFGSVLIHIYEPDHFEKVTECLNVWCE